MGRHSIGRTIMGALVAAMLLLPSAALAASINYTLQYGGSVNYYDTKTDNTDRSSNNYTWVGGMGGHWQLQSSTPLPDSLNNFSGGGNIDAYELHLTVDGVSGYTGYCVEYDWQGIPSSGYSLTSIASAEDQFQHAAWLIDNYGDSGDNTTIVALQALVWSLTTDQSTTTGAYEFETASGWGWRTTESGTEAVTTGWFMNFGYNSPAVIAMYNSMQADLDANFSLDGLNGYYLATNEEGQNLVLGKEVAGTPEPATMLLLGSGLAGLGAWRRRRQS